MFSASGERREAAGQATTHARVGDARRGDEGGTVRPTGAARRAVGLTSRSPVVCTAGDYWPGEYSNCDALGWIVFEGSTDVSTC